MSNTTTITFEEVKNQIELYVDCWKQSKTKFIDAPEEVVQQNFFDNISPECERRFSMLLSTAIVLVFKIIQIGTLTDLAKS